MSDDDIKNRFKRACAFRYLSEAERDRAVALSHRPIKDIAVPMRRLATFGWPPPF